MQACSYTGVVVAGALIALTQFAACAAQNSPPAEPAAADDTAFSSTSSASDMPDSTGAGTEPSASDGASASSAAAAEPSDSSDRDLTQIQAIVGSEQNRKPVRACYEKAQKELPELKGMMTIKFVLDPDGNVKTAELVPERSEIKSPDVAKCAIDVIKSLKFPKSSKGMETTVNYPYNFKPPS
jgi:TonB family protein